MLFNKHSRLEGQHAFLSASKYHWINYSKEKLSESYIHWRAVQRGTKLHAFAADAIRLGVRLPRNDSTLNRYVNDAIAYRMTPEQVLYYSDNCVGTADAISFNNGKLRIHDLKTGEIRASVHQLEVYAAIFCLEYGQDPNEIDIELRIYQNDNVIISSPEPSTILRIMDTIVDFDTMIEEMKGG